MLFINNPQAAKAIIEGRRYDDGLRTTQPTNPVPSEDTGRPSPKRQVLAPRLSSLLSTN